MLKTRYLTKSRFKKALECPTKLFYSDKTSYANTQLDDNFLMALAEGGYQVGELAKLYYPNGINIDELDHEKALAFTHELLTQENVVVFEAAFRFNNLFVRADIVEKKGENIRLIEVKSKSFDSSKDEFLGKKGGITSKWKPYIYDVAYQKHVIKNAHPNFTVSSFLCLADKTQQATVSGMNQSFTIRNDGNRMRVSVNPLPELGVKILKEIATDFVVDQILGNQFIPDESFSTFNDLVGAYADSYQNDIRINSTLLGKCKSCEFKATDEQIANGLRSGFHECWKGTASYTDDDFKKPQILNIWDFRRKDELISAGRYFMNQVTRDDLEGKGKKESSQSFGLSRVDRQWMQVEKAVADNHEHYIDVEGLRGEMKSWEFPLHFIDFETTAVAIPFNIGRRPYEQIAFQFSHHVVHQDGSIFHVDEWINTVPGQFPNFQFIRQLKIALETDSGTIFRYASHENSILNAIYRQLQSSNEADKDSLCEWIKTITQSTHDSAEKWTGRRNMVDLLEIVKKYYYNPETKGSNSLKSVLPAVLNASDFLKAKYSQPVYGSAISSKNFKDHTWITLDDKGKVQNPYNTLPTINDGYDNEQLDDLILGEDAEIADGGAAMIAYARMQFTEMTTEERQRIANALLRYCELDTFAMVMLWEAWNNWCN